MTITCGIDWAESHHDIAFMNDKGHVVARARINTGLTGFGGLMALLTEHAEDPRSVPVAIETDKNLIVVALQAAGITVFPINPRAVARYRERHGQSGKKSDLLTELPEGFLALGVRLLIGVATFPARDQQRGCAAGAVRFGGATARVA